MEHIVVINQVSITGKIHSVTECRQSTSGKTFFQLELSVPRLGNKRDLVPVLLPGRLLCLTQEDIGKTLRISGQYRSYNRQDDSGRSRLILIVHAQEADLTEESIDRTICNLISLEGYICRPPVYRRTPRQREINDLMMAVNRSGSRADYIPCICWGRNARYACGLMTGDFVRITGRIQSRNYTKRLEDHSSEKRVAYEVSVKNIELLKKNTTKLVKI